MATTSSLSAVQPYRSSSADGALEKARAAFGTPDLLINNAGVTTTGPFVDIDPASIPRDIGINLVAPLHIIHTVAPWMRSPGAIVNTISLASITPLAGSSVYSATKFAFRGFNIALHIEMRPRGITVPGVLPGAIDTPMLLRETREGATALNFLGDPLPPEKVAKVILRAPRRKERSNTTSPTASASCRVSRCSFRPSSRPFTRGSKKWASSARRPILQAAPKIRCRKARAAGTLASLGSKGLDVQAELARVLGLEVPPITWHSVRDGMAEAVQLLALISGSLAKIAFDISIMTSTEFGEVSEPFVRHRGASSTMPQKRNPVSCELILAAAKMVRQHAGLMLDAMIHDFERATGPWHLEWAAVPESFALTSGALAQATFMLGGLEVHADRMCSNLGSSRGLIVAEAVMMALAPVTGRQTAHDLVYAGCRRAVEANQSLFDALSHMREVVIPLGLERLRELTDPANYLGSATAMVDQVLAQD
jgi:short-subunit dehydrogenase